MEENEYDEVCRALTLQAKAPLMHWLLDLNDRQLRFDSWLNTVLTLPNTKERVCDAVARMTNLERGGLPCAGIVEFQTRPDPNMFGRMLIAGGIAWITVKPTDLPGDRFELSAIVVNLTGHGDCSRQMILGSTEWTLKAKELNLARIEAAQAMDEVEAKKAPPEILVWVSLMNRGDDADMIQRRSGLVAAIAPDAEQRNFYKFVLLFAGLVDRQELWRKAVEELQMPRSPIVLEWTADARREGKLEGKIEAKVESLQRVFQKRWGAIPEDLAARFGACTDAEQFDRWLEGVALASSLEQFRQEAGL